MCGCKAFDAGVDMWAVGFILAELAGFADGEHRKAEHQVDLLMTLTMLFGTPPRLGFGTRADALISLISLLTCSSKATRTKREACRPCKS